MFVWYNYVMFTIGKKNYKIKLVVARHCSTILNEEGKYQGVSFDYPLTQKGEKEAFELKSKLDPYGFEFDEIFTSDTTRARQTAKILTSKTTEGFITDARLNPFDLGSADAKREDELFTVCRFPILAKNKENFAKYLKRVRTFLRDLLTFYNGKTVLLVTHEDISGLIDSYLSNYFILKAPKRGIKNGDARIYELGTENFSESDSKALAPWRIHFRGPKRGYFHKKDILAGQMAGESEEETAKN